jgi:hypothetical protein
MGDLSSTFDFLKFNASDLWDQAKSHPQRFLWGVDPIMTKLGNHVMGTHYDPMFDQLGGAWGGHNISAFGNYDNGVWKRAEQAGIDTSTNRHLSDIAHVIAAFYALGGASGGFGGGDAGAVDPALGGAGGGTPIDAATGFPASTADVGSLDSAAPALDTGGTGLGAPASASSGGASAFDWQSILKNAKPGQQQQQQKPQGSDAYAQQQAAYEQDQNAQLQQQLADMLRRQQMQQTGPNSPFTPVPF